MSLSRADRRWLGGLAAACALAAVVVGVPVALVEQASDEARRCLADAADRDVETCPGAEASLARLAHVPWVRRPATYRYEELRARLAVVAYERATVDAPDAAARARAAQLLLAHEAIVEEGSKRLTLEELGDPVHAPSVGTLAALRGDRATLLDRWNNVGLWTVRVAALRAALLEADLQRVDAMAARYAEFDPRDADLRTAVGAALCLGDDPGRGLEMLARVPTDRASARHAAISRNWGEVRAVQEACADLASIEPPPMPLDGSAGVADAAEARAVLAMRLAQGPVEKADALGDLRELLTGAPAPGGPGLAPEVRHARAALLAELVVADERVDAAAIARLARTGPGETPLAPGRSRGPDALIHEPLDDGPFVAAATFARASHRVAQLASAGDEAARGREASLREVAAALAEHAALAFAREGQPERAIAEARRAAELVPATRDRDALLLASVAAVSGDLATARVASRDPGDAVAPAAQVKGAGAPGDGAQAAEERARLALVEIFVAASAGREDEARRALDRARSAVASTTAPGALAAEIDAWDRALAPPPEGAEARRAARRAVLARRGDAPAALIPWTLELARLAPEGASSEAVETWLDTALALDAPRFSMREVALARAVAARLRGDAAVADRWSDRLAVLRGTLRDPRRAVVARFLGL